MLRLSACKDDIATPHSGRYGAQVHEHESRCESPMFCTYLPSLSSIKGQNTPFLPLRWAFGAFEGRRGAFLPLHWDVIPRWARNGGDAPPASVPSETIRLRLNPIVEKHVENRRIRLEISGFIRTFAVRKKSGASSIRR